MAKPNETASEDVARHGGIQAAALAMIVGALLLGTLLAWIIVRQRAASEITVRGDSGPSGGELKIDPAVALTLVNRGASLVQMQCSGCHASTERLAGPSWRAIVDRARQQLKQDPFCGVGLALVANAVTHPSPGWDGYASGPQQTMFTGDDRVALAAWILRQPTAPANAATGETP